MFNEGYFSVPVPALVPEPIKISAGYALLRRLLPQKTTPVNLAELKRKLDAKGIPDKTDIFTCYEDKGKKYYFLKDYKKLIKFLKSKKFEKEEIEEVIKSFIPAIGDGFYTKETAVQIFPFLFTELERGNDINPYFNSLISILKPLYGPNYKLIGDTLLIRFVQTSPRMNLFAIDIKKRLQKKIIN